MKFGSILGSIVSQIVMLFVFISVFITIGLLLKLFKKDVLNLKLIKKSNLIGVIQIFRFKYGKPILMSFIIEIIKFLAHRKKYWLIPIMIVLEYLEY